jgi:hypothetical protein
MPPGPDGHPIENPDNVTFQKVNDNLPKKILFRLEMTDCILQCIYANQLLSSLAIALTRWSILLFYSRIFTGHRFKISLWVMYVINTTWGVCFFIAFLFQCVPISMNWSAAPMVAQQYCIPHFDVFILTYATSSVIIDAAILVLPWQEIIGLSMPGTQKAAVLAIFGLGAM